MLLKKYLDKLERDGVIRKPYDIKIGPISDDNVVQVTVTQRINIDKICVNVTYEE